MSLVEEIQFFLRGTPFVGEIRLQSGLFGDQPLTHREERGVLLFQGGNACFAGSETLIESPQFACVSRMPQQENNERDQADQETEKQECEGIVHGWLGKDRLSV